jgi:hypothetical protein
MKKTLLILLIGICQLGFAQKGQNIETPKVDKRVELLSIVFRLAGNEEYNGAFFKKYTDRVDAHFNAFRGHELIQFAKELHRKGISYDAVASMAIFLDERLKPVIDFSTALPSKRWAKEDATKFVTLLQKFYKDAQCDAFFRENDAFYKEVAIRFQPAYKTLDFKWFPTFFGNKADDNFNILLSPGCGGHNYGPSYSPAHAKREVFAIMGTWRVDDTGMPVYDEKEYQPILIHEFSHSFVNVLLEKNEALFEDNGKKIYQAMEYEMSRQQAYGSWQIMLNEALVRASVINYFMDHGVSELETNKMMIQEFNRGFVWIQELVGELKKFKAQRDQFSTLESYLPVLSKAYASYAEKVGQYDAQRPRVVSIAEFANNAVHVSPQVKTITIHFDRPLQGKGYSVNYGNMGKSTFPKMDSIYYANENKSIVMNVQLMPNKDYQFVLTGNQFKSAKGYRLKTYEVNFKTSE